MKEIGMLFSGEMVRAILDERKTQTRRLARDCRIDSHGNAWQGNRYFGQDMRGTPHVDRWRKPCDVGDRIYVRETWSYYYFDSDTKKQFYYYKADYPDFEKGLRLRDGILDLPQLVVIVGIRRSTCRKLLPEFGWE